MKHHAKGLLVMIVPTMAFGWIIVYGMSLNLAPFRSADIFSCHIAILHTLFPVLDQVSALCIAACLTPTDPVTCAAITRSYLLFLILYPSIYLIFCLGGKFAIENVREDIRHVLSAESASNDGLAYPFLSIAIYLTVETSTREAIEKWLLVGCLCELLHVEGSPQVPDLNVRRRSSYSWHHSWSRSGSATIHYSSMLLT